MEDTLSLPLVIAATKGGDEMIYKDISHNPDRITSDDGNGWELIAAAIIERAAKDYKIAFMARDHKWMKEIERFFFSKYFNTISLIEPKEFMRKYREKLEEERREKERKKKGKKHEQ